MRATMRGVLQVLIALLALQFASAQLPDYVVELTDEQFEHDTQAASGQTTGTWFVLLFSDRNLNSGAAEAAWDTLAKYEEKSVIYASVDVDDAALTGKRFKVDHKTVPKAIMLRDMKMYEFPGPFSGEDLEQRLHAFATGGYEQTEAMEVPAEVRLADLNPLTPAPRTPAWYDKYLNWKTGLVLMFIGAAFRYYAQLQDPDGAAQKALADRGRRALGLQVEDAVVTNADDGQPGGKAEKKKSIRRRA